MANESAGKRIGYVAREVLISMNKMRVVLFLSIVVLLVGQTAAGASLTAGLKAGKVELKSAGALAFGPEGILFVGDSVGGAIYALDTADRAGNSAAKPVEISAITEKIAAMLGTTADQILIN